MVHFLSIWSIRSIRIKKWIGPDGPDGPDRKKMHQIKIIENQALLDTLAVSNASLTVNQYDLDKLESTVYKNINMVSTFIKTCIDTEYFAFQQAHVSLQDNDDYLFMDLSLALGQVVKEIRYV
jgi:hypothetical protein